MKLRNAFVTLIIIVIGVSLWGCSTEPSGPLSASGFVEGETYHLIAPLGGKVDSVNVALGDPVSEDQDLIEFDPGEIESIFAQAQANMDQALAAQNALSERPDDGQVDQARTNMELAEVDLKLAQSALELLKAFYEPLDPPDADLHRAEFAVEIAGADVELAQALLDQAIQDPVPVEWDIAAATIDAAKAQIDLIHRQREELTIRAPVAGVVSQLLVKPGEIISAGTTVAHILDPSVLRVTLYIPVDQVTETAIGAPVRVSTDSYPDEQFEGRVIQVANQAQFTPTLVLTEEERVKLVFAVEVRIESGFERLKPGMPVDVEFIAN